MFAPGQPTPIPATCPACHRASAAVSGALGLCRDCARSGSEPVRARLGSVHAGSRVGYGLPAVPPRTPGGVRCHLCSNECRIGETQRGYCGLRTVRNGRLFHLAGTPERGLVEWYRDPLPTNCVADWVCAGSRQRDRHNLAVFYASCTMNCLFCQNWHFRETRPTNDPIHSAGELAAAARADTFCVCFFGGDPASQMPHALAAAKRLAPRGVRVCWETNGTMHPRLLDAAGLVNVRVGNRHLLHREWHESNQ